MSDVPETATWRFTFPVDAQAAIAGVSPIRRELVVRDAWEDESAGDACHVVMRDAQGRVVAKVPHGTYLHMERVTDDEPEMPAGFKPTSQVVLEAGISTGPPA